MARKKAQPPVEEEIQEEEVQDEQQEVQQGDGHIVISPLNMRTAEFCLKGTAPLVLHKFTLKALLELIQKQQEGDSPNKKKKAKDPRDFALEYLQARHISTAGWDGIPASAFRSAMIEACRVAGFKMTVAKMAVFVDADGYDISEPAPLVKIVSPAGPTCLKSMTRIGVGQNKTTTITVRPMWMEWGVRLRVSFDADQFSLEDVAELLKHAGAQNGVGEGRPNSKTSTGQGWGTWTIVDETDPLFQTEVKDDPKLVQTYAKACAKMQAQMDKLTGGFK